MTPDAKFIQALAALKTAERYVVLTKEQKDSADRVAEQARLTWGAALNRKVDAELDVDIAEAGIILALRERAANA